MAWVTSYSACHCVWNCAYAYFLQYIRRVRLISADITESIPGSIIHNLAKLFFLNGASDWSIFTRELKNVFDEYISQSNVYLDDDHFASSIDEAYKIISKWSDNFVLELQKQNLVKQFFLSEGRFEDGGSPFWLTPDIGILGGWDLICGDSRESPLILTDFKASNSLFYLDKRQLYFYALGVIKKLALRISLVGFLLFKTRAAYYFKVTPSDLKEVYNWILQCKAIVDSGNFQPSPSKFACALCPFKTRCDFSYDKSKEVVIAEGNVLLLPEGSL